MKIFNKNQWALILGGSSGFGLASAKKLSAMGMSVCVVHRDRKGAMSRIEEEFNLIRNNGNSFISLNDDALSIEGQARIIEVLNNNIKNSGTINVLLHSIALGNLKPIAPVSDVSVLIEDEHSGPIFSQGILQAPRCLPDGAPSVPGRP